LDLQLFLQQNIEEVPPFAVDRFRFVIRLSARPSYQLFGDSGTHKFFFCLSYCQSMITYQFSVLQLTLTQNKILPFTYVLPFCPVRPSLLTFCLHFSPYPFIKFSLRLKMRPLWNRLPAGILIFLIRIPTRTPLPLHLAQPRLHKRISASFPILNWLKA
jgi:hypothetical protein